MITTEINDYSSFDLTRYPGHQNSSCLANLAYLSRLELNAEQSNWQLPKFSKPPVPKEQRAKPPKLSENLDPDLKLPKIQSKFAGGREDLSRIKKSLLESIVLTKVAQPSITHERSKLAHESSFPENSRMALSRPAKRRPRLLPLLRSTSKSCIYRDHQTRNNLIFYQLVYYLI